MAVRSLSPNLSKVSNSLPTLSSMDSTMAAYVGLRSNVDDQFPILLDQGFLGIERSVDRELPVVEEEWFVLVLGDPCHGFITHAIFDMLLRRAFYEVFKFPWSHEAPGWARPGGMRQVHVETLLQRRIRLWPQMPFPKMPRGIAAL